MVNTTLGKHMPTDVTHNESETSNNDGQSFVLEITKPSRMAYWASKIAQMRREGMKWEAIAKATGLSLAKVQEAQRDWLESQNR